MQQPHMLLHPSGIYSVSQGQVKSASRSHLKELRGQVKRSTGDTNIHELGWQGCRGPSKNKLHARRAHARLDRIGLVRLCAFVISRSMNSTYKVSIAGDDSAHFMTMRCIVPEWMVSMREADQYLHRFRRLVAVNG